MAGIRFDDPFTPSTHLSYTVTRYLESFESPYQRIDVFEAEDFGTVLALGGVTNVTDRDESAYHEMLAHVPLFAHPNPQRVLIIGGGDGGTLREVLRHPSVTSCVLVDIDAEVIRCARTYFPALSEAFDDSRAEVIVGDGLAYVRDAAAAEERFDVVLIDSTDPVDAAVELFTPAFYTDCATLTRGGGILVPQSDSPAFCIDRVRGIHEALGGIFAHVSAYVGQTMTYPGGLWAYIAASDTIDAATAPYDAARVEAMEPALRYFNEPLMRASFALPTYIRRGIRGEAPSALPSLCDTPPSGCEESSGA